MKLSSIDLNLFVVFEAIYTERNLTRAAEILNVTQPAVSNALARLRAALDDPLFERRDGAMAPTPAAQELIQPVRQALTRLRSGLDQRTAFDPARSDRAFHIAMRDTMAATILPILARHLEMVAPHVHIQCHFVDRAEIPRELAAGTLDLAVEIPQLARPDLSGGPLFSDRYVCIMRRNHPAARRPLTLERFTAMRQIVISGRRRGRTLVEAALARNGHAVNAVLRLPTLQMAMDVVLSSDLITTAPRLLARSLDVTVKELPFEVPTVSSHLFWHRNVESDPANRWLREELMSVSAEYLRAAEPSRAARGRKP